MNLNPVTKTDIQVIKQLASRGQTLHDSIWDVIDEIEISGNLKTITSGQCYFLALEHMAGVFTLFENEIFVPAYALLRPLTEAFIRGAWLQTSASDQQIAKFQKNGRVPPMASMIAAVENTSVFSGGILTRAHKANWKAMCGLTHNGPEGLTLSIADEEIGRILPPDNGRDALNYVASMGILAAMGVTVLAECNHSAHQLLELGESYIPL